MLRFKSFFTEAFSSPYNVLKIGDLRKDENRPANFIKKIAQGLPFQTTTADDVIINKSELEKVTEFMTADEGKYPVSKTSMKVQTSEGELTIPNSFLKSPSFGGRGQGSGTGKEEMARADFNDKLTAILKKENLGQIELKINGRTVDIAYLESSTGRSPDGKEPKSDFTLVNALGEPQAYLSHKAGRTAKDYQQYGGLSSKRYLKNREVASFMKDVAKKAPNGLSSGETYYRKVKDKQLALESMYGLDYGGAPSVNNCDEFHLGNMSLKGSGAGPYEITSTHKGTNGDIPGGEFAAYLIIRYQARRGDARAAGQTVKNARVGIFPKAKIVGTSKEI